MSEKKPIVWILKQRHLTEKVGMYWITSGVYSTKEKALEDAVSEIKSTFKEAKIDIQEEYLGATVRAGDTIQYTVTQWDVV